MAEFHPSNYMHLHRWIRSEDTLNELTEAFFSRRKYCGFEVVGMYAHPDYPMMVTFVAKKPVDPRALDDLPGQPANPEDIRRDEKANPEELAEE